MDKLFVDELPKKLSREEEMQLLIDMNNGSNIAREKLINHNIRLIVSLVFKKYNNTGYDYDDLISVGCKGLINGVDSFNMEKNNRLSTYLTRCIDNQILLYLRDTKKHTKVDSIDRAIFKDKYDCKIKLVDTLYDDSNTVLDFEKKELITIMRNLIEELPDREKEIVKLYYGFYNDKIYNQTEIANILNISHQWVSRILSKTLKQFKSKLIRLEQIECNLILKRNKR